MIGAFVQALQADPSAESGDQVGAQVGAYLSGQPVRAPLTPQPPPGSPPVAPGPVPGGPAPQPGGGSLSSPPLPLPPGSPAPEAGAPVSAPQTPAAPASAGVTLSDAMAALSQVQLNGRAWLIGQIGSAETVEVAITDKSDRQRLADAATFPVSFRLVAGEPKEQSVEITAAG